MESLIGLSGMESLIGLSGMESLTPFSVFATSSPSTARFTSFGIQLNTDEWSSERMVVRSHA